MPQPPSSSSYEERIAHIRTRFVGSLTGRLQEICTALHADVDDGSTDSRARTIHRLLHDLIGSAAMLEVEALETVLRPAVHLAERVDEANGELTDEDKQVLNAIIERAQSVAEQLKEQFSPT